MLLPLFLVVASTGFEKNLGQTDSQVRYLLRSRDVSVFLTDRETVFRTSSGSSIHMESVGKPVADSVASSTITSYVGPRERWREDVPVFDRIVRRGVFPGIALVHYGAEYDYVVAPGANPRAIAVRFTGQKTSLRIDEAGSLVFDGDLRHRRPVAYQRDGSGGKTPVDAWFQLNGDIVTFGLGAYDSSRELIIDPEFEAVRFYGGSGDDVFFRTSFGLIGYTNSIDYPYGYTNGAGGLDLAVYTPNGTYFWGGSGDERILAYQAVQDGYAFVGETTSRDLPVGSLRGGGSFPGMQTSYGGGETDGFVLRLWFRRPRLSSPLYTAAAAGYLGGSGADRATAVALPLIFVETDSKDLPATREPAASYLRNLDGTYGEYFDGAAVQTAAVCSWGIAAGAVDGSVRLIDPASNLVLKKASAPGGVRAVQCSDHWGVIATGDGFAATFRRGDMEMIGSFPLPEGLRVTTMALDQNYAMLGGRTARTDLPVTAGAPQQHYGGGDSDGFVLVLDVADGEIRLLTYAGGVGDDEVISLESSGGLLRANGTSNAGWGSGAATFASGVDTFETALQLPLLASVSIPARTAYNMQFSVAMPNGGRLTSSNPQLLRVLSSGEDGASNVVETIGKSGSAVLTVSADGYWPSRFLTAVEPLRVSFDSWLDTLTSLVGRETGVRAGFEFADGYLASDSSLVYRRDASPVVVRIRMNGSGQASLNPPALQLDRLNLWGFTVFPLAVGSGEFVLETEDTSLLLGRSSMPYSFTATTPPQPAISNCAFSPGFSRPLYVQSENGVTLRSPAPESIRFSRAEGASWPQTYFEELFVPRGTAVEISATGAAPSSANFTYLRSGADKLESVACVGQKVALIPYYSSMPMYRPDGPQQVRLEFALPSGGMPTAIEPVAIQVTSTSPDILRAEWLDGSILLTPLADGKVTVRVESPVAVAAVELPVDVRSTRPLWLRSPRLGKDLMDTVTVSGMATGASVVVESLDPDLVLVSLDNATPGSRSVTIADSRPSFVVQALAGSGTARIRLHGGDYEAVADVELYPSFASVGCGNIDLEAGGRRECTGQYRADFPTEMTFYTPWFTYRYAESTVQSPRPGLAVAPDIRIEVADPAIASVTRLDGRGDPSTPVFEIQGLAEGQTSAQVSATGFPALPRASRIPIQVRPAAQ